MPMRRPGRPDAMRPLTASGQEAARLLGDLLAERQPDAVVSSPLLRARETAAAIAAAAGLVAGCRRGPRAGRHPRVASHRSRRPRRHRDRGRPPARLQRDRARAHGRRATVPHGQLRRARALGRKPKGRPRRGTRVMSRARAGAGTRSRRRPGAVEVPVRSTASNRRSPTRGTMITVTPFERANRTTSSGELPVTVWSSDQRASSAGSL